MSERFEELAAGARELRVELRKGDVEVGAGEDRGWSLEWSSPGSEPPEILREGNAVRVRQRQDGFLPGGLDAKRMDVRLTLPAGVEDVELRTGLGRVSAEGLHGRMNLTTGNGAMTLRSSEGNATLNTGNGEVLVEGFAGDATATTGNGRVRINGLEGKLSLNTGNGPVEVLDVEGRVRASTGNGDLRLISVAGEAEINTGHGQIEVGAPRSLSVQATTAMGGIRIEGGSLTGLRVNSMMGEALCSSALEPGRYELTSGMGTITLYLAPDAPVRVDAQTGFGQVDSDFPLVRVGRSGPMGFGGVRMVGSIGEGEPRVDVSLRSGKGTIRLRRASVPASAQSSSARSAPSTDRSSNLPSWFGGGFTPPAPPTPPHHAEPAPHPEPAPEPRPHPDVQPAPRPEPSGDPALAVLEAVARGELTPEQAEEMLRHAPAR